MTYKRLTLCYTLRKDAYITIHIMRCFSKIVRQAGIWNKNMCASCASTAKSIEDFLREELSKRDLLQKHQLSLLPVYVDESLYLSSSTTLTLQPQCLNEEIIRSVVAYVQNGPATLTLGNRVFTLPSGLFQLSHIGFLLRSSDVRSLVQASAGLLSLELMGEEVPTDLQFSSW